MKMDHVLLLPPVLLVCAAIVGLLLVRARIRWRTVGLLMAAGTACGVFCVVAKFEPTHRALFPFRYEADGVIVGNQNWQPHRAPDALVKIAKLGRLPTENDDALIDDLMSDPNVTSVRMTSRAGYGPGHFPAIVYYDPNFSCAAPTWAGTAQTPPPHPGSKPGVRVYRGAGALLYYAFGPSGQNALLRGSFWTFYHGAACAVILLVMRRLSRSARQRLAVGAIDRGSLLVRAAWWSLFWPALAMLAAHFFWDLYFAWLYGGLELPVGRAQLPLALGQAGVGGIWLGAALGHAFTICAVTKRMAKAESLASNTEPICSSCGYPLASPSDRCPECGRIEQPDSPQSGRAARVRRLGFSAAKWVLVALLLCAPITLPLVGALLPSPVVDAIGHYWYQLPWAIQREFIPTFAS